MKKGMLLAATPPVVSGTKLTVPGEGDPKCPIHKTQAHEQLKGLFKAAIKRAFKCSAKHGGRENTAIFLKQDHFLPCMFCEDMS